ncbi:hypothetical protein ACP4OV_023319 [Aristida adscensionis]
MASGGDVEHSDWVDELHGLVRDHGLPLRQMVPLPGAGGLFVAIGSVAELDEAIIAAAAASPLAGGALLHVLALPTTPRRDCRLLKEADAAGVYGGGTRFRLVDHGVVDAKAAAGRSVEVAAGVPDGAALILRFGQEMVLGGAAEQADQMVQTTAEAAARAALSTRCWLATVEQARLDVHQLLSDTIGELHALRARLDRL